MGFGQAISAGFSNYVNFSGRACRSEYWYWVLFVILADIVAGIIDYLLGMQIVSSLFGLRCCRVSQYRSGGCTTSIAPVGGFCSP
jgi:uncharacterized membrane protein YhaH (DUF805 family)